MTTSWSRIALLYAIGVLAAGQLGIVPPLVPGLQHDLGLSLAAAGMAVSVITLVGAVFGLPAGGWSRAHRPRARTAPSACLIMAVAAALCAAADDAATLLAARALAGIGYLLVVVAGPSLMAATAEPRHQPVDAVAVGHLRAGRHRPRRPRRGGLRRTRGWRTIFAVDLVAAGRRADRGGPRRAARRRRRARRRTQPLGRLRCAAALPLCRRLLLLRAALPGRSPDCCPPISPSAGVWRPPTPAASSPSPPPSASPGSLWPAG